MIRFNYVLYIRPQNSLSQPSSLHISTFEDFERLSCVLTDPELDQRTSDESSQNVFPLLFYRPGTRPCNKSQTAQNCTTKCPINRLRAAGTSHGEYRYSLFIKMVSTPILIIIMNRKIYIYSGLPPLDDLKLNIPSHIGPETEKLALHPVLNLESVRTSLRVFQLCLHQNLRMHYQPLPLQRKNLADRISLRILQKRFLITPKTRKWLVA